MYSSGLTIISWDYLSNLRLQGNSKERFHRLSGEPLLPLFQLQTQLVISTEHLPQQSQDVQKTEVVDCWDRLCTSREFCEMKDTKSKPNTGYIEGKKHGADSSEGRVKVSGVERTVAFPFLFCLLNHYDT